VSASSSLFFCPKQISDTLSIHQTSRARPSLPFALPRLFFPFPVSVLDKKSDDEFGKRKGRFTQHLPTSQSTSGSLLVDASFHTRSNRDCAVILLIWVDPRRRTRTATARVRRSSSPQETRPIPLRVHLPPDPISGTFKQTGRKQKRSTYRHSRESHSSQPKTRKGFIFTSWCNGRLARYAVLAPSHVPALHC
jgi:hypothetical protein